MRSRGEACRGPGPACHSLPRSARLGVRVHLHVRNQRAACQIHSPQRASRNARLLWPHNGDSTSTVGPLGGSWMLAFPKPDRRTIHQRPRPPCSDGDPMAVIAGVRILAIVQTKACVSDQSLVNGCDGKGQAFPAPEYWRPGPPSPAYKGSLPCPRC